MSHWGRPLPGLASRHTRCVVLSHQRNDRYGGKEN
nr:MAG TPA: hypothetical protein [Caudoviricetes sp.]DAY40352.1 MAG TPA: hypothetical protein [Caudoviricetes sp.]